MWQTEARSNTKLRALTLEKGNNMSEQKATMSEAEFAKAVGVSRVTLWRLRLKGQVPHYRLGKRILYGPQHVAEFLRAHERSLDAQAIPPILGE